MFSSNTTQVSNAVTYIEDVFSTYVYSGNGSTQTITNGIDLAGKGGLVWAKCRTGAYSHMLQDTVRGSYKYIQSDNTVGQNSNPLFDWFKSFNSDGFTVAYTPSYGPVLNDPILNASGQTYASWTFRKQPKFFDVVTFTTAGDGSATVNHTLGSTAGMVIIKGTSASDWLVYHRSLASTSNYLVLQSTSAAGDYGSSWITTSSTQITFPSGGLLAGGSTYVMYLYAHNAGGFGLTGTDNVISCGSYTGNGTTVGPDVNLGYEPQFLMVKNTSAVGSWFMWDSMRGITADGSVQNLTANASTAETTSSSAMSINATGFSPRSLVFSGSGSTYIYIAIRRGPMKVPTSGTSVFAPVAYTGTNVDNRLVNTGIVTDMTMARIRTALSTGSFYTADRLRGDYFIGTAVTDAEATDADSFMTPTVGYGNSFSAMNGFGVGNDATRQLNQSSTSQLAYAFQRAPSFFDEVCYTGTGVARTVNHNLGVAPELILLKCRNAVAFWPVYAAPLGTTKYLSLNQVNGASSDTGGAYWNNTSPTSSVFSLGIGGPASNSNGNTYVAYLFATCAGVSKVGSYTGTDATQTINCGFSGGARFVLIKKTNGTGNWLVWDSARGMISGTDPSLRLNSNLAEQNSDDVYAIAGGFQLVSAAGEINGLGDTYIYLAIA